MELTLLFGLIDSSKYEIS